jgi:hypothetical protein
MHDVDHMISISHCADVARGRPKPASEEEEWASSSSEEDGEITPKGIAFCIVCIVCIVLHCLYCFALLLYCIVIVLFVLFRIVLYYFVLFVLFVLFVSRFVLLLLCLCLCFADYRKSGDSRGPLSPQRAEFKAYLRYLCTRHLDARAKVLNQPREYGDLWDAFTGSKYAPLLKLDPNNFSVGTIRRELEAFHNKYKLKTRNV